MDTDPQGKSSRGRNVEAAVVVMLLTGPLCFLLWSGLAAAGGGHAPFDWTWHAPAAATLICGVAAFHMPQKLMESIGRFWPDDPW